MFRLQIITEWVNTFDKILLSVYRTNGNTVINEQILVIEKNMDNNNG